MDSNLIAPTKEIHIVSGCPLTVNLGGSGVSHLKVVGDKAALTYTIPMPSDDVTREAASVLEFVKAEVPRRTTLRTCTAGRSPQPGALRNTH